VDPSATEKVIRPCDNLKDECDGLFGDYIK